MINGTILMLNRFSDSPPLPRNAFVHHLPGMEDELEALFPVFNAGEHQIAFRTICILWTDVFLPYHPVTFPAALFAIAVRGLDFLVEVEGFERKLTVTFSADAGAF